MIRSCSLRSVYRGEGVFETKIYGKVLAPHLAQVTIQQITPKKKCQADGRVGIFVCRHTATDASEEPQQRLDSPSLEYQVVKGMVTC